MNRSFELIQTLVPYSIALKTRANEDLLIVSNHAQEIFYLNETAKDFYLRCNNKSTIYELYRDFLDEYDVASEGLQQDLVELIRTLQWQEIIHLKETKDETV